METRHKSRPVARRHPAHSLCSADLGEHDPGRYRLTPPGAPDVPALVRPGMAVRTSYGSGGIVIAVEGPAIHRAPDGSEYPHFTKLDRNWINECVAVHGRILKLLEANSDEIFVEPAVAGRT